MADLIPVNMVVADRTYRLKIQADDEEMVRATIKIINEKIVEFKTNFAGKDMQDYVAMVLLWFATEQQKPNAAETSHAGSLEKLRKMEQLIDKSILKAGA